MTYIILFLLLVILSYLGVWFLRRYTQQRKILDLPNERSSHTNPTPIGGGWAIVILVLLIALFSLREITLYHALVYVICATVLAWVGWRDDVHSLSPALRFIVQGAVAGTSIYAL